MMMASTSSRADAIRSGLIAHVQDDLSAHDGHRVSKPTSRDVGRASFPGRPSVARSRRRGWAVVLAVMLVGGVTGVVYTSAMNGGAGTVAAPSTPSPEPSATTTPAANYPTLPAGGVPLTAEGLAMCRDNSGLYAMGQLAIGNNMHLPQVAYNDLAAYLITDFPDQIAATGGGYGTTGLQIIPAAEDLDIRTMFDRAKAQLIPEFQVLVSLDGITVSDPIGYSFEDVCRAYLDARYLGDQASNGSGLAFPWSSLSLSALDARVRLDVPHDVPPAIREMESTYGSIVQVTVMPEGYQGTATLYPAIIEARDQYSECTVELMEQIRGSLKGPVADAGYATACVSPTQAEITVQPGLGKAASDLLEPYGPIVVVIESPAVFGYSN